MNVDGNACFLSTALLWFYVESGSVLYMQDTKLFIIFLNIAASFLCRDALKTKKKPLVEFFFCVCTYCILSQATSFGNIDAINFVLKLCQVQVFFKPKKGVLDSFDVYQYEGHF